MFNYTTEATETVPNILDMGGWSKVTASLHEDDDGRLVRKGLYTAAAACSDEDEEQWQMGAPLNRHLPNRMRVCVSFRVKFITLLC